MFQIAVTTALLLYLVWVSIYDIRTHKIENYTHLIIIIAAFFINDLTLAQRVFGCVFLLIPFLVANIVSDNKIGMGDVKLVGAFGFVLGVYGGIFSAVSGLTIMLLTAGIYQQITKQKKAVPLAPFLCGGFALTLILSMKGMIF